MIGRWWRAGLLLGNLASGAEHPPPIGLDLIAFRNDEAVLERWADLAAIASRRGLPRPDEIAALAAVSQAGTGFTVAPAEWFHSHRRSAPEARFVQVADEDLSRDDRAFDSWGESEEAVIQSMASEIRIRGSVTVVTQVHPDNLDVFYRNWHAWRFPRGMPVKVIASGIEQGDLFFVRPEEAEIHFLNSLAARDRTPSVREIASLVDTEHWIRLDPHWYPLPGADLFMHEDWMGFDLVVPAPGDSTQPVPESEDSPPSPEPGFSLLRTSFAATVGSASERDLAGAGRRANGRVAECDPGLMGWRRVGCPTEAESGAVGSQRLRPP